MESTDKPWFEEIAVTPIITHAVEVLRAAVPQSASEINLSIEIDSGQTEFEGASLTEKQAAAAWLLVAVAAYHHEQMIAEYGEVISEDDRRMPPELQEAGQHFAEDVRRKLNIKMSGSAFRGLSGLLTVFA